MLGKLSVPGRPTSLDDSRARAYCACSRCGWGLFGHFFPHLSILYSSPSLWETAQYRLKYCVKGPLNPKQPTSQPTPYDCLLISVAFVVLWYREPGTNWFAKTCDFKMCREARDYYLTNDELSLDNNASLW